jgi:hypothetical protein
MLCLEVAVNGERYCLAGADDVWSISARVASSRPIQRLFRSGFDLSVRGWRGGNILRDLMGPYWGEWARHLNVGDVVTIRLVESNVPDSPRHRESSAVVDELSRRRSCLPTRRESRTVSPAFCSGWASPY